MENDGGNALSEKSNLQYAEKLYRLCKLEGDVASESDAVEQIFVGSSMQQLLQEKGERPSEGCASTSARGSCDARNELKILVLMHAVRILCC